MSTLLWGTVRHRPYVFAFLACFLVLAVRQAGWRRTLTFALPTWALAFAAEFSSTRNGFPFGFYAYDESTRTRELWLSNVPSWDSLSFVFLSWFSFVLAGAALTPPAARGRSPWPALLHPATPILGGLLMMLLDVVIDPVTLQGDRWFLGRVYAYPWDGFYFGVTAANFAGWWLVGATSQWLFQALLRVAPWCGGPWPIPSPLLPWAAFGVYAGVLAFMLAVTVAIGDLPLAAASAAVSAATLGALAAALRGRRGPIRPFDSASPGRTEGSGAARVLICAATRSEASACRSAPAGADVEVLRTGVGPVRSAAALQARLAHGPQPELVVSSGLAGALTPDLPLHACITAEALVDPDGVRAGPAVTLLRAAPLAQPCTFIASADLALDRKAPARSAAVDMESAALARVAETAGLPFAVLRVVSDTPAAPFPAFAAHLTAALSLGPLPARLAAGARAAAGAARSPRQAIAFARASLAALAALRAAWRAGGAGLLGFTAPRAAAPCGGSTARPGGP